MAEQKNQCNSGYTLVSLEQLLVILKEESNRPVLVACLHEGEEWQQLTDDLQTVAERFAGRLLVLAVNCTRESESTDRLGLLGTPTYVMYAAGREVGRLIGRADPPSLISLAGTVLATSESRDEPRNVSI